MMPPQYRSHNPPHELQFHPINITLILSVSVCISSLIAAAATAFFYFYDVVDYMVKEMLLLEW